MNLDGWIRSRRIRSELAAVRNVARRVLAVGILIGFSSQLGACKWYFPPPEQKYRAIEVYKDHYEFRFNTYTSASSLSIALQATTDDVEELNVKECVDPQRLKEVLDVLRALGRANIAISMPPDC